MVYWTDKKSQVPNAVLLCSGVAISGHEHTNTHCFDFSNATAYAVCLHFNKRTTVDKDCKYNWIVLVLLIQTTKMQRNNVKTKHKQMFFGNTKRSRNVLFACFVFRPIVRSLISFELWTPLSLGTSYEIICLGSLAHCTLSDRLYIFRVTFKMRA